MKLSRRKLLALSAATAGASCLSPLAARSKNTPDPGKRLPITIAGYRLDRVEALYDGRVQVEGCNTKFVTDSIGVMNTNIFAGPHDREVSEVGLHPYMLAYANDGFRKYSLIPVFPIRVFRHKNIFVRADGDVRKPADLRGRKVATPGFSSTSLTWIRGIIQHEYGVRPDEIEWVVSAKDSSYEVAGKLSKQEDLRPEGLTVSIGTAGKDESDLLLDGDVDAVFHAAEPKAYVQGDERVVRLFPDFRKIERDYYARTGVFPIMHAVAIRNDIVKQHPWLPRAVFDAYVEAKQQMYTHMDKMGWATHSIPWFAKELEETKALMGENFWPYGIESNKKALEVLFQYSHEQGLAKRKLKVSDLFLPESFEFIEKV
jgi:4,5-dihydroxyphthalate decarboxylase